MTHAQLVTRAVRWLRTQRCVVVVAECGSVHGCQVPDAIGWRVDGASVSVECKTSVADFRKDRMKRGHVLSRQVGQLRYYMTPQGLFDGVDGIEELLGRDGHVFVSLNGNVVVRKHPLPATEFSHWQHEELMLLVAEMRRVAGGFRGELKMNGLQTAKPVRPRTRGRSVIKTANLAEFLRNARAQNSAQARLIEKLRTELRVAKALSGPAGG